MKRRKRSRATAPDTRTTAQRGYGSAHQRLRKQWAARVANGGVACARCGLLIRPGEPWDLDHTQDRQGYLGPSHQRCNRAAAGRRKRMVRAVQNALRRTSREW